MLREFITTIYIGIVVLNTYIAGALGHIGSGDNCPNDCQGFSHRYCVVSSYQCSARGQVGSGGGDGVTRSKKGDHTITMR